MRGDVLSERKGGEEKGHGETGETGEKGELGSGWAERREGEGVAVTGSDEASDKMGG